MSVASLPAFTMPRLFPNPDKAPKNRRISTALVTITPELAAQLLERNTNTNQRKIRRSVVDKYVADMNAGNWKMTGQTISLGTSGRLIDGQQRLTACIESGKTFESVIATDVPDDSFVAYDKNSPRTLKDTITGMGLANGTRLGFALALAWQYSQGTIGLNNHRGFAVATDAIKLNFLKRNPSLAESVAYVSTKADRQLSRRAPLLACLHFWGSSLHAEQTQEFIDRVLDGDGVALNSPIGSFRAKLLRATAGTVSYGKGHLEVIGIKSLNAHLSGADSVKQYRVTDAFPTVKGYLPYGFDRKADPVATAK